MKSFSSNLAPRSFSLASRRKLLLSAKNDQQKTLLLALLTTMTPSAIAPSHQTQQQQKRHFSTRSNILMMMNSPSSSTTTTADDDKTRHAADSNIGSSEDALNSGDEEEEDITSKLTPEELEAKRNEEQMERFRLFREAMMGKTQNEAKGEEEEKKSAAENAGDDTVGAASSASDAEEPTTEISQEGDEATIGVVNDNEAGDRTNTPTAAAAAAERKTNNSVASDSANLDNDSNDSTMWIGEKVEFKFTQTTKTTTSPSANDVDADEATTTTATTATSFTASSSSVTVEVLHPDSVIWEMFVEHPDGSKGFVNIIGNNAFSGLDGSGGGGSGGVGGGKDDGGHIDGVNSKPSAEITGGSHFADIAAVDPFSRGKVMNYINRHKHQLPSHIQNRKDGKFFEVEEKVVKLGKSAMAQAAGASWTGAGTSALNNLFGAPDSVYIYRAKLHVPLPSPHSSCVAEGLAESEKDAECLAAMHAERVIDSLGVPLYRLPSAQTKHAEAARKAGRKAPFPDDPISPEGSPLPMPLRMISSAINDLILRKYGASDGGDDNKKGGGTSAASSNNSDDDATVSSFHKDYSLGGACHEAEIILDSSFSSTTTTTTTTHHSFTQTTSTTTISSSSSTRVVDGVKVEDINLSNIQGLNMTSRQMYSMQRRLQYEQVSAAIEAEMGMGGEKENSNSEALNDDDSKKGGVGETAASPTPASSSSAAPISPYSVTGTTSAFVPPAGEPHNPVDDLYQTFHYPWRDGVNIDDTVDPNASPEQIYQREQVLKEQQLRANANRMGFGNTASTANKFDPTENNTFQITNILSVRFSPSDDSLQLAAIFDKKCVDRIKEWLQVTQGVFDMKSRIAASQVAVVGFASRMFVVELSLDDKDPTFVAKGKAVDKDVAIVLACMHAELLIDATGRHLFPKNAARQAKHANEVQGYGRWAAHPSRPNERPPTDYLPLPLKQQLGIDDVWLDASQSKSLRTPEERLLAAHNEINMTVYDFIEVNPDPRDCKKARETIRRWQREVARSRIDDLYVITRMGDYFRASCVLPVPPQFGTRGGNAIGRSPEQAMDLCALHCLDVLCSLNIPVFRNPAEQKAFVEERRKNGNILPNEEQGIIKPPPSSKRVFIPYTPGYLLEGEKLKPLPPVSDLSYVMGLAKNYERDFILPIQQQSNEKDILEHGNDARMNVQMYCRRTSGIIDQVPNILMTGYAKGMSVFNVAYLPILVEKAICHQYGITRSFPAPLTPGLEHHASRYYTSIGATNTNLPMTTMMNAAEEAQNNGNNNSNGGDGSRSAGEVKAAAANDSSSSATVLPDTRSIPRVVGDPLYGYYRFLAVGASLKKADSIRMCFLNAAEILKAFGIDHTLEKGRMLMAKKTAPLPSYTPPPPKQPPQQQQQAGANGSSASASATVNCTVNNNTKPTATAAATMPPQQPLPPASTLKPVKPRRLQPVNPTAPQQQPIVTMTINKPAANSATTTAATTKPPRVSRLQQVAPPVGDVRNLQKIEPTTTTATPAPSTTAATSSASAAPSKATPTTPPASSSTATSSKFVGGEAPSSSSPLSSPPSSPAAGPPKNNGGPTVSAAAATTTPTTSSAAPQQQQQQPSPSPAAANSSAFVGPTPVVTVYTPPIEDAPLPSRGGGQPQEEEDLSRPPRIVPRPFYHPVMQKFFHNAKIERAHQRRIQNGKR